MRNEEKLKKSYENQKLVFELARDRKISGLEIQRKELKDKIEKLTFRLNTVESQISETSKQEFCSFRTFQERAIQQSKSAKEKNLS